jgi:hypothetical protein
MAWKPLAVNYTDAIWVGLKKYVPVQNEDGTVSFRDVTEYSHHDNSFFGAKDANAINEAINSIMASLENGTDLYTAFQNYFAEQKELFEDYTDDMKANQSAMFEQWFGSLQTQLSGDVAGNLQNHINNLDVKTDGFEPRETVFSADGKNITETYGNKRIETEFVSDSVIIQKIYVDGTLARTKTITFRADGLKIKEDIK